MATTPPRVERKSLIDLLLSSGLLDRNEASRVLGLAKQSGKPLLRVVVDERLVDEERLVRAMASALGMEAVAPASMKIHERVLALVPARLALRVHALPIAVKRSNQVDYLYAAMADPLDMIALEELARASNCRVNPVIAPPTQLDAALQRYYGEASKRPQLPPAVSSPPVTPPPAPKSPPPPPGVSAAQAATIRNMPLTGLEPRGAPTSQVSALQTTSLGGTPPPQGRPRDSTLPVAKPSRSHASSVGAPLKPPPIPPASTAAKGLQAPPLPAFPGPDAAPGLRSPPLPHAGGPGFRVSLEESAKTQLDVGLDDLDSERDVLPHVPSLFKAEPRLERPEPPRAAPPAAPKAPPAPALDPLFAVRAELQRAATGEEAAWDVDIADASDAGGAPALVRGIDSESQSAPPLVSPAREELPDALGALEAAMRDDLLASRREAAPNKTSPSATDAQRSVFARTMEVPVSLDNIPSPFDALRDAKVRAGLELTGIIPAVDFETESFEPAPPARGKVSPALAGFDDIPASVSAVRARGDNGLGDMPLVDDLEPVSAGSLPPPAPAAPPPPPPNFDAYDTLAPEESVPSLPPELEPSIEEILPSAQQTEPPKPDPDEVTNPRLTPRAAAPAESGAEANAAPIERALEPWEVTPPHERIPVFEDPAAAPVVEAARAPRAAPPSSARPAAPLPPIDPLHRKLVDALLAGDSLNSAERAQLLLALARALVKSGVIGADELARELSAGE